jgi:hypothetical protein
MISKNVNVNILLSETTLESTYTNTQAESLASVIDTGIRDTLNLLVEYTTGASETSSTAEVIVWGCLDENKSNKQQIGTFDLSSGNATFTPTVINITGGAGGTTYKGHFVFGITWKYIYVQAKESGVSANKGNITVIALTQ